MRLIDADAIWGGQQIYSCEELADFIKLIREAPTIAPPPNDPLTISELREMDGEPVWVVSTPDADGERLTIWALVSVDEENDEVVLQNSIGGRSSYEEVREKEARWSGVGNGYGTGCTTATKLPTGRRYRNRRKETDMKNLTLYVCEICGTQYKDKLRCEQCEKTHKKGLTITGARYLPYTKDRTGMPETIDITVDGKMYRYKR